tara:strand:+ start:1353 stop:1994 length:642 start_codon:yes stop_codon:yes gene_type:complete
MNVFTLSDDDNLMDKINLDDLFEKKREISENKLQLYNKILNRIHEKIKLTSRVQQGKEQFCWYLIPEMMIGISRYNVGECTDYILRKLRDNDFVVRYTHPNLVFISWAHWIPGYVRQEYKKQTGTAIDGYGNLANSKPQIENNPSTEPENPNDILFTKHKSGSNATNSGNSGNSGNSDNTSNNSNREYNSTKNYKPAGIYNNDIMQKIQDKFK